MAMVDLIQVEDEDDTNLLMNLINEFWEKTESEVAEMILNAWETESKKFVKVFPHEYQRVLKDMKLKKPLIPSRRPSPATTPSEPKDIEDLIPDPNKLDKLRGFMKYKRIKTYFRDVNGRINQWSEVYDFKSIRENVRVQATR